MKFIKIIAAIALLSLVSVPALGEYTDYQKGIAEGLKIGFFMNQKYTEAMQGINVSGYNLEVERYNAWIESIFGKDPNFLMTAIGVGATSPVDIGSTPRPILIANNTTSSGIVHEIDGGAGEGPTYTTNDMNLLSDNAIAQYQNQKTSEGTYLGMEYLGGV